MSEVGEWIIYGLVDPRDGRVRYVGWTVDPRKRLLRHLSAARNPDGRGGQTHTARWIRTVLAAGETPEMKTLQSGHGSAWAEAERGWIKHYRANEPDLTNAADGGQGAPGVPKSDATIARLKASKKGQKPSPLAIERSIAARKGRPLSEAHKARLRLKKGWRMSDEARARISQARRTAVPICKACGETGHLQASCFLVTRKKSVVGGSVATSPLVTAPAAMRAQVPALDATTLLPDHLVRRVEPQPNGCWVWVATHINGTPAVREMPGLGPRSALRVFARALGVIDGPEQAMKACATSSCVNPFHAEVIAETAHRVERCRRGHPLLGGNVFWEVRWRGGGNMVRRCAACRGGRGKKA